ncbi:hypothetical protein H6S82_21515 [Planktothrix sp. FACHB-1355]|uniref:Uncharacterized protein n=1 Tax=Aerosakkonema funiforme FACHB-1375 TaxID=2949571 RepID=A0A926VHJ3_9CYAN|nr:MULTISPECIES: hypothetical protein [Oscillatoriales]MBD2183902.1 hypothetical protein [Aerosakkonema funiforme FACHB-1375]MBD3561398.1 hypothetical protein [Planktothrix sp. FACHB-1355]
MTNYDREPVRVLMHLNGGYTKVTFERVEGQGLADGGVDWDIPTQKIPFHLRNIGSRFFVIQKAVSLEKDTIEDIREILLQIKIEEM